MKISSYRLAIGEESDVGVNLRKPTGETSPVLRNATILNDHKDLSKF